MWTCGDSVCVFVCVCDVPPSPLRRYLEHEGPIVLIVYMVQQINCVRNRAGEIVEVR